MIHELHLVIPPGKLDDHNSPCIDLSWHLKPSFLGVAMGHLRGPHYGVTVVVGVFSLDFAASTGCGDPSCV